MFGLRSILTPSLLKILRVTHLERQQHGDGRNYLVIRVKTTAVFISGTPLLRDGESNRFLNVWADVRDGDEMDCDGMVWNSIRPCQSGC